MAKRVVMDDPEILMTLIEMLGPDRRDESRAHYLEYKGEKVELGDLKLMSIGIEESKELWTKGN